MLAAMLMASPLQAGGTSNGRTYSNFGLDLAAPIFPLNGKLEIYKNKSDRQPLLTLENEPVIALHGDWKSCVNAAPDGWGRCTVNNVTGWVRRHDFRSGGEYEPVDSWPFRYWLYIATSGIGGEETYLLRKLVPKVPYLVAPSEYDNIFFHVLFDSHGRAISPKTQKLTDDRVFLVGNAVYLAPENTQQRNGATWLFLTYYNKELTALCPAQSADSCMSAVNLSPSWHGIKQMYDEPPELFKHGNNGERWYGEGEVAFARHIDPVRPLLYQVPDDVHMRIDTNASTDAQRTKSREKLFCIADCGRF